jgi:hypothetical protein
MVYFAMKVDAESPGENVMSSLSLRIPVLLLALGVALPAIAQTDPAIARIRANTGVSQNQAAEQMIASDEAEEARADRGEEQERETPTPADPLPTGEIEVGDVQSAEPLEAGEEPDPAADAADAAEEPAAEE